MNQSNKKLTFMVYTALCIAMVTLCTMIIKVPSVKGGYVNFGDIVIFITAVLLGKRAGMLAGGIGSAMADLLLGYSVYAPATFVIKGLEGFLCALIANRKDKEATIKSMIPAVIISAAWMVLGYFIFEFKIGGLLFANESFGFTAAVFNLPGNIVQGTVSALVAIPFILALRKTKLNFNLKR
ncbi:thiamine precursor transporter HmpT [Oxobacter pfennigii]|uniref:Thiamine transporter HmpT n=1 Tax=Oxobacter pfennigii TaxID=36849 RepID=A0A0P8Y7J6_9CLOT|nr:ECF transporter S component [Oxobacter pfennigii]KPU42457.1 thiamine precursor transporter HmpT [Oxobacter pfennigii]